MKNIILIIILLNFICFSCENRNILKTVDDEIQPDEVQIDEAQTDEDQPDETQTDECSPLQISFHEENVSTHFVDDIKVVEFEINQLSNKNVILEECCVEGEKKGGDKPCGDDNSGLLEKECSDGRFVENERCILPAFSAKNVVNVWGEEKESVPSSFKVSDGELYFISKEPGGPRRYMKFDEKTGEIKTIVEGEAIYGGDITVNNGPVGIIDISEKQHFLAYSFYTQQFGQPSSSPYRILSTVNRSDGSLNKSKVSLPAFHMSYENRLVFVPKLSGMMRIIYFDEINEHIIRKKQNEIKSSAVHAPGIMLFSTDNNLFMIDIRDDKIFRIGKFKEFEGEKTLTAKFLNGTMIASFSEGTVTVTSMKGHTLGKSVILNIPNEQFVEIVPISNKIIIARSKVINKEGSETSRFYGLNLDKKSTEFLGEALRTPSYSMVYGGKAYFKGNQINVHRSFYFSTDGTKSDPTLVDDQIDIRKAGVFKGFLIYGENPINVFNGFKKLPLIVQDGKQLKSSGFWQGLEVGNRFYLPADDGETGVEPFYLTFK